MQKLSLNHDERGEVGDTGETPSETHLFKKLPQTTDRRFRLLLCTPHSTLHTLRFTLSTPHFTLYTPHSRIRTSHSTHCIPHSTLHFLYTPHFALPPPSTFHSLQCAGMVAGENGKTYKTVQIICFTQVFYVTAFRFVVFFAKIQSAWGPFASKHCCDPCNVFCRSNLQGSCAGQGCGRRCELKSCMMFRRVKKHRGCPVVW